jgi:hypothetical protein
MVLEELVERTSNGSKSMLRHLTNSEIDEAIALCDAIPKETGGPTLGSKEGDLIRELLSQPNEDVEFYEFLSALSHQKRRELTAVALLGRDLHPSFQEALRYAKMEEIDNDGGLIYLTGITLRLSKYLREGQKKLRQK